MLRSVTEIAAWYLIRTRQHKEALVQAMLSRHTKESFLPMFGKSQIWRSNRPSATSAAPLFPCYVFARFNFRTAFHSIQRAHGVVGVVSAGSEPCEVPEEIIHELKARQRNGLIEVPEKAYCPGQHVVILGGSLEGIHAIFDRYLSGPDRVAVILRLIGGTEVRAVVPSYRIRKMHA